MIKLVAMNNTLYIFIDESGNFDFSLKGTSYFVVYAYITKDPVNLTVDVSALRYRLLESGYEHECFHATEDKQFVRNSMYEIIAMSKGFYSFVYVEKVKLPIDLQNKKELYTVSIKTLLSNIFIYEEGLSKRYTKVIVIMDKILTKEEKSYLYKIIRPVLKKFCINFKLYFFQTKSDYNAQIADYGSWARYVGLERGEYRPLDSINHLVRLDINILNIHI